AARRPAASDRSSYSCAGRTGRDYRLRGIARRWQWTADGRQGNRAVGDLWAGRLRTAHRHPRRAGARDAGRIAAAIRPSDGSRGHRRADDLGRPQPERVGRVAAVEGAPVARSGGGIAMALVPGTRGYTKAIVTAQMLAQIGAFALPALLPNYIARWNLSKTE